MLTLGEFGVYTCAHGACLRDPRHWHCVCDDHWRSLPAWHRHLIYATRGQYDRGKIDGFAYYARIVEICWSALMERHGG